MVTPKRPLEVTYRLKTPCSPPCTEPLHAAEKHQQQSGVAPASPVPISATRRRDQNENQSFGRTTPTPKACLRSGKATARPNPKATGAARAAQAVNENRCASSSVYRSDSLPGFRRASRC